MDHSSSCVCRFGFILAIVSLIVQSADLNYRIPEELAVDTFIGDILSETDNLKSAVSVEDYPNLRFSFLTEGNAVTSLFSLDEKTGVLKIGPNSTLDRETLCPFAIICEISLEIVVQSNRNQLFRKVSVTITLDDINDNPPIFNKDTLTLDVSEAVLVGASIPIDGASDRDRGQNNSLQTYEVVPKDGAFGVSFRKNPDGTSYLNLVVKKELDHETKSQYSLQIVAKDGGSPPLQGVLNVIVTVTDVNDNLPKFSKEKYSVNVDENVPANSVIVNIHATDKDSGENGELSYKLSSHQNEKVKNLFQIDPTTGNLTVKGDLQKEATDQYNVIVEATDHALQPFTSQTVVTINVRDVINSPPKLTVNVLSGSTISEYANLNAVVAHVAVKESDRGRNGIVTCQLQSTAYFELQGFDVDEYKIIVAKKLDSEVTQKQNITIFCQDAGTPPLTANYSFSLTIIDENDNFPAFMTTKYSATISENNAAGKSLLSVYATDLDSGSNGRVHYELADDASGKFRIIQENGTISAAVSFDFESSQYENFSVLAIDEGKPAKTATATVSVRILDENDVAPEFSKNPFKVSVSEAARPGEIVSKIVAVDNESGKNGVIVYSLFEQSNEIPFILLENGSLILDRELDYERRSRYEFEVVATDKGTPPLETKGRIVVEVEDENDNVPIITFPKVSNYIVNTSLSDPKGTIISRIRVDDLDSGLNGEIHYVITSRNDSGRFGIDAEKGELFLTRELHEKDVNLFRLVISAKDKGSPPLAQHVTLFVKVTKGNGTSAAYQETSNEKNILITLTIVCVTIVISAIIVLIIVIIRHRDRKRQTVGRRQMNSNGDPSKYDDIKKTNVMNDMKSKMADDTDFGFHAVMTDKGSTFTYSIRLLSLSPILKHQRVESKLSPYKLQVPNTWLKPGSVPDDTNSVASGETTTSDSGRGGSEEDIYSHNGTHNFGKQWFRILI
ncbi:hypothetical protein LOTGIDRAFT_139034 [Lottia gigantea]|uniref:Cadherin domain-containing protein n=1 Tax=Lottia gigantea TaxID=225164 RepID=V4CI36_LOTGI|nr:hypothetical protein LOTGIDRAFT_139034 [Lottia gigantea]ESP01805.1 hypothetical protein LOTGIDRAFT_139034 [Lottia gigantea]